MRCIDLASDELSLRLARIDTSALEGDLEAQGWSIVPDLLTAHQCGDVAGLYGEEEGFRSRVVMARYGFGRGEYRYFSYPLPSLIQ